MIKLLTFDLDNTLWDVESVVMRAERIMRDWIRREHAEFADRFDFRDFLSLREAVLRERPDIAHDLTRQRLEVLRRAFCQGGYAEEAAVAAAEAAFAIYFEERNRVSFFPGVESTLAALKPDFDMLSISNGNADIHKVGLSGIFRRHFSAISVGVAKPDARIYQAALDFSGVQAAEAVHIGDDPEQDVAAAAALGMKTVWVNFAERSWPDLPRAHAEIRDFAELLPVIRRLQAGA